MSNVFDNWFFKGGIRFDSANELMDLSAGMDKALKTPLYTKDYTTDGHEIFIEKWDGIMNLKTKEIAAIASDKYMILQHQDCINNLASGILRSGHDVAGSLFNYGDSFIARYLIQDSIPTDDEMKGIHIGCEVRNSYNKSSSFRGGAFMVREVCSNGMVMKSLLNDVNFSVYHTAKASEKSASAIAEYIDHTIEAIESKLGVVIRKSMESELLFDSADNIQESLADIYGVDTHAKNIIDHHWDGKLNTTRWDLYNAATEYVSHTEMSPAVQERLIVKSEMILDEGVQLLCVA